MKQKKKIECFRSSTMERTKKKLSIRSSAMEQTKKNECMHSFLNYETNTEKRRHSFLNYLCFAIATSGSALPNIRPHFTAFVWVTESEPLNLRIC